MLYASLDVSLPASKHEIDEASDLVSGGFDSARFIESS